MVVLVADAFEQSGIDGLKAAGCEVVHDPALDGEALAAALRPHTRRCPRRPFDQGHRGDDGRGRAGAGRPGRRRLQHDRCRGGVRARDLRVELPGPQRRCGCRADARAHPGARSPYPGQRRRVARREVGQEGVFQGGGSQGQDAWPAGLRRDWARGGATGPGVRLAPARLEPQSRSGDRHDDARPAEPRRLARHTCRIGRRGRRRLRHPQHPCRTGARDARPGEHGVTLPAEARRLRGEHRPRRSR